jgi:uncharacterized cupin superfamily protein
MRVAGEHLGASPYELLPGESTFPYHYELGNDELLVVMMGNPVLRDPDGERQLEPGDCVLFASGPGGGTRSSIARMRQYASCSCRASRYPVPLCRRTRRG